MGVVRGGESTPKNEDDVMPPPKEKKPLTPREIELFKKWIQQGAPYADHWAFVKPKLPVAGADFLGVIAALSVSSA